MDYRITLAAFWTIFFAEVADRTQIASLTMSATSGKPFSVWLGSVTAFTVVTAVSVTLGMLLSRYIKPEVIRYAGGVIFILIGALILSNRI